MLDSRIPEGELANKWSDYKSKVPLVSPSNKQNIDVIVIGTGLAGASAAASMAEMGYNVKTFCFQDSPRRAHSIAAQGGINAAKNTRMMVIVFIDCFMTQLKAVTIGLAKPMYIDLQR